MCTLYNLGKLANVQKTYLLSDPAFLRFAFRWQTTFTESGIADKEEHTLSDEFCWDPSSVQILFIKQETLKLGLRVFETKGTQIVSAMKEQLIISNYAQATSINCRFDEMIKSWNKLLANDTGREPSLIQEAFVFNSWFDNAEENMTDPVQMKRCR